ncbi:cation:proton antiporter [Chloroflexota bacterium]
MILVGFLGGALAHRLKLPRITGYIVIGVIFSPSLLNIIPQATVMKLDILTFLR